MKLRTFDVSPWESCLREVNASFRDLRIGSSSPFRTKSIKALVVRWAKRASDKYFILASEELPFI
ncbi:MAG: hypothetical protein DMG12_08870 [Acidobacteria bacterium]|nr:MAG: hypothetical protein DMG12_08870 [Acidobacteriota bacterium]